MITYKQFNLIVWSLRIFAAAILLQTLFFKFTAAPESVFIFSRLYMEPWGRLGTGIIELIASVLILIPRTTVIGALLAALTMFGAILSHLLVLGIAVQGDHGQLFALALAVFICAILLLLIFKKQVLALFLFFH